MRVANSKEDLLRFREPFGRAHCRAAKCGEKYCLSARASGRAVRYTPRPTALLVPPTSGMPSQLRGAAAILHARGLSSKQSVSVNGVKIGIAYIHV